MSLREKLGSVLLLGVIILAVIFVYQWHRESILNAVAQAKSDAAKEAQQKLDEALSTREKQFRADFDALNAKFDRLQRMTPAQIVEKVPIYIPQAPEPVTIASPTNQPKPGDAIVPQADIKPIAEAILAGKKCDLELGKCQGDLKDFQQKYTLAAADAKNWEQAAKGGSKFKRTMSTIGKVAIGVGLGYALAKR